MSRSTVRQARRSAPPVGAVGRPVRALLADGTVVRLRELQDADAQTVSAFYRELPVYDRFLRFFSAGAVPAPEDLIASRRPADISLGAFRGETLIGVAQCACTGDPSTAEVALAVAYPEQTHGVGTLLLEHLASRARRAGVRRFVADVLTENGRVRQLLADVGLPLLRRADIGEEHVEFDLDPGSGYLDALAAREERADVASLAAVLTPRSVVVVGAGRRSDSVGHAVLHNLVRLGFTGRLAAVNPHAEQVCGVPCLRSVTELAEPFDLAVLCVPAAAVPMVAEQCGRQGVRALLVVTSGLSGDAVLAAGLLDAVRRHDMRMVGPNCLGLANTDPAMRLDATFAEPAPAGSIGLVTQSGGVAIAVQAELRRLGLGVSTAVSTGDKYDVSGNDLLLWWHGDERTRLAVLHLESFGNPRKFSRFARRLAERDPVLTVRSGSSAAGQRAAASHTASTATPRVTRDALFRQAGVLAVDRLDELTELVATLSWQPLPAGRRIAIVSNAGGAGVLAADACEAHGLAVPPLSDGTQRPLSMLLPRGAATANPVDTSAVVSPAVFASAVSAVRADPERGCGSRDHRGHGAHRPLPRDRRRGGREVPRFVAVRLGQAEHVTGLPRPRAGRSRSSPMRPPRPRRSGTRPPARSGWPGRAVTRRTSPVSTGCARVVSWRGSSPTAGGRVVGARAGAGRPAGVRAAACSRASLSTARTTPWPRSRRRGARSRSRRWPTAYCTRRPPEACGSGSTPQMPCAARRGVRGAVRSAPARIPGPTDGGHGCRTAGRGDQRSGLRAAGRGRARRNRDGPDRRPGPPSRAPDRRRRRGDARRLPRRCAPVRPAPQPVRGPPCRRRHHCPDRPVGRRVARGRRTRPEPAPRRGGRMPRRRRPDPGRADPTIDPTLRALG